MLLSCGYSNYLTLQINKFNFVLEDCDDFVKKFMLENPDNFPNQKPDQLTLTKPAATSAQFAL